mmetsp:Transcript_54660/g.81423  ORF Transcript_54660/g.81423 Transcript_54660/m.81423 type:complete len:122 (-) Transcript_54660:95-460(-)
MATAFHFLISKRGGANAFDVFFFGLSKAKWKTQETKAKIETRSLSGNLSILRKNYVYKNGPDKEGGQASRARTKVQLLLDKPQCRKGSHLRCSRIRHLNVLWWVLSGAGFVAHRVLAEIKR